MADNGPARASGWLGVLWPLLQTATPITLLFGLAVGYLMLHEQNRELERRAQVNQYLADKLLTYQEQQLAWLRERVHCAPAGETR